MAEIVTMIPFCAALFASVARGWSIIPALLLGLPLFAGYGLVRGHPLRRMAARAAGSVASAGTILVTFVLIGVLTSLWRAGGTIPFIVVHATAAIHAAVVVPFAFLLCSAMSVLTGSSFASAATMGTICMSLGLSMHANAALLGGAILAGVYVGDRCSPVSTSALLVSQLTRTNLFDNLGRMVRTGAVPFLLSCAAYAAMAVLGMSGGAGDPTAGEMAGASDVVALFSAAFDLRWPVVVPAVLVIVLALLRVDVRMTMLASIAASLAVCVGMQGMDVRALALLLVFGYDSPNPRIDALLGGGGLLSMISVAAIVCISSAYAGIFAQTGMLLRLQRAIGVLGRRIGASGAMAVTAACTAAFACNQTLTIMLTHQLCEGLYARPAGGAGAGSQAGAGGNSAGSGMEGSEAYAAAVRADRDGQAMAIDLEDTAVVIAPLIPWSIAGALPLATINAPTASLAAACFLYLLPLSRLVVSIRKGIRKGGSHGKTTAA